MHGQRVVVTDSGFEDLDRERRAAENRGASFEARQCRTAEEVRDAVAGAAVAVVQFAPVDGLALAGLSPGARLIRYGVGFDNIDVAAARARGHDVAYVPDYCAGEVADHTAAMALALLRGLPVLDSQVRDGGWGVLKATPAIAAGGDVTVGFLGLGRIGQATLARLRGFGFDFVVDDPRIDERTAADLGLSRVSRAELLGRSDVVILHLPLSDATHHVLDAEALAAMKPGALLVNTARGGLIDEAALARALEQGHLGGAALDVFETEPLPADSPLRSAPRLLLSPHASWYSRTAIARLQTLVADEIDRALTGQPPRCPVPAV